MIRPYNIIESIPRFEININTKEFKYDCSGCVSYLEIEEYGEYNLKINKKQTYQYLICGKGDILQFIIKNDLVLMDYKHIHKNNIV